MAGVLAASATLAVGALMSSSALGSAEHPQLYQNAELKKPGVKVPVLGWGTIKLSNRHLGFIECATTLIGDAFNATEPAASTERAYGEVLEWSATSYMNASGGELTAKCKSGAGFLAYPSAEPPLDKTTEVATVGGKEELVIKRVNRRAPALPWRQEAEGTENPASEEHFYLKTGIATTEREAVEAEEAGAGVPTEQRSGCYPNPPVTEIVRMPGFVTERETELAVRPAPAGCVQATLMVPELGLETPLQGTLEPEEVNGTRNGLTPSEAQLKGGFIGEPTEIPSERSSERNGRHLESPFGPVYVRNVIPTKGVGYLRQELLQLK